MLRRFLGRLVLGGCGLLFALLVIVVVLALTFGPPALFGNGEQTPVEKVTPEQKPPIEQPTPAEKSPLPTPDKKAEQKKKEEETQTVTIRVTGTPGVAFRGGYATGAGTSDSDGELEGVTPQDFEVPVRTDATEVAANVAKQDGEGEVELTLQLLVGDEVVKERSSTAGWVSV